MRNIQETMTRSIDHTEDTYAHTGTHSDLYNKYLRSIRLPDIRYTQLKKDRPKFPILVTVLLFFSSNIHCTFFWTTNNRPLYELKRVCNFISFHSTLTVYLLPYIHLSGAEKNPSHVSIRVYVIIDPDTKCGVWNLVRRWLLNAHFSFHFQLGEPDSKRILWMIYIHTICMPHCIVIFWPRLSAQTIILIIIFINYSIYEWPSMVVCTVCVCICVALV